MKRLIALLAAALLLLASLGALAEEAVNVQGFWYSDETEAGIELKRGEAIISNADGETTAEGSYEADAAQFSFTAGGVVYNCTVSGNQMQVDAGQGIKHYARDGIEENYWTNSNDDSAIELNGGRAWQYNNAGDLIGEGTYVINEATVTITIGDKVMTGIIDGAEMTVDGAIYMVL